MKHILHGQKSTERTPCGIATPLVIGRARTGENRARHAPGTHKAGNGAWADTPGDGAPAFQARRDVAASPLPKPRIGHCGKTEKIDAAPTPVAHKLQLTGIVCSLHAAFPRALLVCDSTRSPGEPGCFIKTSNHTQNFIPSRLIGTIDNRARHATPPSPAKTADAASGNCDRE